MNKFFAKHLSQAVSGFGGMLLHFFIVSAVLGLLLDGGAIGFSLYAQAQP